MSEEYNYYGEKITTFEDYELKEMMKDIIDGKAGERPLTREEKITLLKKIHNHDADEKVGFTEHLIKELDDCVMIEDDVPKHYTKFRGENILSSTDKELLIEYAPLLFNTSTNYKGLIDDMYKLVELVWEYRLYESPNYGVNYVKNHNFNRYAKDPKDKIKSFSGHIDALIELMGSNFSSGTPKDPNMPTPAQLKVMLKYAKEHSDIYLPTKPKVSTNKNIFKDYLKGLNLGGKSDEIEAFSKCIE